eukprot:SAG22_NODE_20843_length_262_cov_0.638037_1_plen_20_part_01
MAGQLSRADMAACNFGDDDM